MEFNNSTIQQFINSIRLLMPNSKISNNIINNERKLTNITKQKNKILVGEIIVQYHTNNSINQ